MRVVLQKSSSSTGYQWYMRVVVQNSSSTGEQQYRTVGVQESRWGGGSRCTVNVDDEENDNEKLDTDQQQEERCEVPGRGVARYHQRIMIRTSDCHLDAEG